jgi:hypothetical protein
VPVVLNMISSSETTSVELTQKPLPRFGMGACLRVPEAAATSASQGVAYKRPSAARTAPVAGFGLHSGLTVSGQPGGSAAASDDQQSAYNKTLTIADGAGDLGPHPAREPV